MTLFLFSGTGSIYGTGHQVRVDELISLLPNTIHTKSFVVQTPKEALEVAKIRAVDTQKNYFLLDLRDINPLPFLKMGTVVTLDNHHITRKYWESNASRTHTNLCFYDTLPHPNTPMHVFIKQSLISPSLLPLAQKRERLGGKILLYAGPFIGLPNFSPLFSEIKRKEIKKEIIWIGTHSPPKEIASMISYYPRLDRKQFIDVLNQSEIVFCYPGMTLVEAWFLQKKLVLFSTESQTHNTLSGYLEKMGLLYFQEEQIKPKQLKQAFPKQKLPGNGYPLLVKKLLSL